MKPKKVVSLRYIAERVGVSRMTVSLALRDDGRISASMRERVHVVAHELGYVPNPRIGSLMAETARTRHGVSGETLAFMTSEATRDGWRRFDPCGTYKNVELRAAEYGYRVEPWWIADPALTPARANQIILARGIRGVIIPNISQQCFISWGGTLPIEWKQFCVAEIGGGLRKPDVNQVLHDHQVGMFMALDELEALGYRRIGLCLRSDDDLRTHHRWSGAYFVWRALRGHGHDLQPLLVDELKPAAVRRWVLQNRLEAVVSLRAQSLAEWRLRAPKDIGFAALHLWGEASERTSGVDQKDGELAAAAVDMLVTLLRRNQKGLPAHPMRWLLRGRWVAGETTRQVRPVRRLPGIENELLAHALS